VLARLGAEHRAAVTEFLRQMLPWRAEAAGAGPAVEPSAPEEHLTRARQAARSQAAVELLCRAAAGISRHYRLYGAGQRGH
jgi:hypothetical protein